MTISQCLDTAVAGGELAPDEAAALRRDFERFRASRENGGSSMADEQAKADLVEALTAEAAHKRRKAKLALKNIQEVNNDLRNWKNAKGEYDIAAAALDKLEHFGTAKFSSVAGRQKAITGMAHAKMEEALHHFRRGAFGGDKTRWNKAQLDNVVKEAFGEDSGDLAAKGFARAWYDTHEWLRQRFNAAGGAIGKLENWGLPQHHDPRALRKATKDGWKEAIRPRLDLARMRHPLTGKTIEARELDGILDEIWLSVTTDGWIDRQPSRSPFGRGALANQNAEHRFLIFRDATTWMEYQRDFGGGDPFASMMGHINKMSRDIAAMEILGPNPSGTVEWMKQAITREAELAQSGALPEGRLQAIRLGGVKPENAQDYARGRVARIDAVWRSLRGDLSTPVNAKVANTMGAVRSIITASVLGQAALSAFSDIGFATVTRRFAGLNEKTAVPDLIKAWGTTTRREAVQAGLIFDSAMNVFNTQARYVGTLGGPEWANYIADRVLTWSGLTPWTQASRHAFGLAFQAEAANRVNLSFPELPDAFRRTFERHGIRAKEWDTIRRAQIHQRESGGLLRPAEIDAVDQRLAERWLEMIQTETEYAVPNSSHRARTALLDQNQPGTIHGEFIRSASQFKSFGAVVMLLHGARNYNMFAAGDKIGGAKYLTAVLFSTAILGAASMQAKQLAAGRDPRDMTDAGFWGAALLQGGGLGIYGDFLFADINRFGGGFASTIAGPVVQRANDFWNLTAGNAIQLASGETTHFGRELVRFAKGNIPGSNIWYLKLAFERVVMDQLARVADPEADKAFKNRQQFWRRSTDQEYFWRPGELVPDRGPALDRALGN